MNKNNATKPVETKFVPLNGPAVEGQYLDYKTMLNQPIEGVLVNVWDEQGSYGNARKFYTLESPLLGLIKIPGCRELEKALDGVSMGVAIRVTFKGAEKYQTPNGERTINRMLVERAA